MYIKKQRLFTIGPAPLYPPAWRAGVGTANDVLMFAASVSSCGDHAITAQ
jgi:hypothetical protein